MIILAIIIFILILTFAYGAVRGAPWVPTWGTDVERFMRLADIKPGQVVYDLGCGDGRLLVAAAQKGAHAIGYEVSLVPYVIAYARRLLSNNRKNISIHFKDFWFTDLADADVVYVFLMQKIYDKLRVKLEQELRPGTKVIVYVWPIEGWQPVRIDETKGQPKLYIYER